ncbi:hypothetical protein ACHAWF_003127 [Thalassiosira exigua]
MAPNVASVASVALLLLATASLRPASARYLVGNRFAVVDDGPEERGERALVLGGTAKAEAEEEVEDQTASDDDGSDEPLPQHVADSRTEGSLVAAQFSPDPHARRDKWDMLRKGEIWLAGIRTAPRSLSRGDGDDDDDEAYENVYGEFCAYDPLLNRRDPSRYPASKDVVGASEHCGEHRYALPLDEAVRAIHPASEGSARSIPVAGLLFHQGRAGAGAISNALTAFDSALVISEHAAIQDALAACDVARNRYRMDDCSTKKRAKLVRDVIALLARTNEPDVTEVYLKLDAGSAAYLPVVRRALPEAPWTFSYRDAGEVLAKHSRKKREGGCAKARRNPTEALRQKSAEAQLDLEALERREACALHLSTLLESAVREAERTGTGMLVSYRDVKETSGEVILEEVLPYLGLGEEVEANPEAKEKVREILRTKSDARGVGRDTSWDKSQEEVEVSEEVRETVRKFMGDVMGGHI